MNYSGMNTFIAKLLRAINRVLLSIEATVIIVAGVLITVALFYGAIVRYVIHGSFPQEAELSWLLYTWLVFIGSSYVLSKGDHPTVTFIRGRLGKIYNLFIYLVCIVYVSIILRQAILYSDIFVLQKTATMGLPLYYFYAALILGFIFIDIRYIMKVIDLFVKQ
ncbi:TRAP transporter small permease [Desulfurococcus amylolyticus]|uniref:Tripartite ATP-independent periplasmic transporter DctQ component n=1 Tax=Desulfurococcus amylolyticus DSM 16532 TaxID=768672 RepID=I3XT03_DESAM|nr:TRAP transporter small permease subunit [Desulfurococcus amylolyticus]AFL67077.1 Tripartite ATP-independent periplasmic transporter DctQ component [Desulfurococcus amylolyticus DSM 16532]